MRVGLIARAEDRGLGILTWEWYRNIDPDRTLVVSMGALARGFHAHLDRYPDATVAAFDGHQLDEATVRDWLDGLDVVYTAETFYDPRLVGWAAEAGVATVLHTMPEFYRSDLPEPTAVWAPTTWRLAELPSHTRLVPVPVPADRWPHPVAAPPGPGPTRWLHVAGHRAAADRNGTTLVLRAARMVGRAHVVTVTGQDGRLPSGTVARGVKLHLLPGGHTDYWELYRGHHALLSPRRYGGLSLPLQEAMGAGLGTVTGDTAPHDATEPQLAGYWAGAVVAGRPRGYLDTPGGRLTLQETDPRALAAAMDHHADPHVMAELQARSRQWAALHSWDHQRPRIMDELAAAARTVKPEASDF